MWVKAAAGRMLALAALALSALTLAAPAQAQSFPRTLDDIKIYGKGEAIEFAFSQPYEGTPTEEHKHGWASLNFGATGSQIPVRDLRPKGESFYKQIKVVQNQYSTTVTFIFKDAAFTLRNRLRYTHDKNTLTVDVGQTGSAVAPAAVPPRLPENMLLREMEQRIAGVAPSAAPAAKSPAPSAAAPPSALPAAPPASLLTPAPSAPTGAPIKAAGGGELALGGMSEGDFFVTLATMVAALAVIILVLYGVLFLYRRFLADRFSRFAGGIAFKQIASFAVGPRQRIVILEINGEMIACGVTPSQITFLTRLSGGAPHSTRRSAAASDAVSEMPASITGLPARGPTADAEGGTEPVKPDPVHQFAELLKQKVRSLKRIN